MTEPTGRFHSDHAHLTARLSGHPTKGQPMDALANYDNPALFAEIANAIETLAEPHRTRYRRAFDDNCVTIRLLEELGTDNRTIHTLEIAIFDDQGATVIARLDAARFGLAPGQ